MINKNALGVLLAGSLMIVACGGGGGGTNGTNGGGSPPPVSTQLSGVAATGAAMSNATIEIKDAGGTVRTKTATMEGGFQLDVASMTFPALLRATSFDGTTIVYGVVFESQLDEQVAITPVSSLVLTSALNMSPADAYAGFNSAMAASLDAAAPAAATGIYNSLTPVMTALGISLTMDELYDGFVPNHTGVDRLLDSLTIRIDGTTATITDKFGTAVAEADLATDDSFSTTVQEGVAEGADAALAISAVLDSLNEHCKTLPIGEACTSLLPATFKHAGITDPYLWATWYQSEPTSEAPTNPAIVTYRLLSIDGKDENGYQASYTINVVVDGVVTALEKDRGYFKDDGTGMAFHGDGENMWLDFTFDEANNALYLKARTKVAPPYFQYLVITGAGVPPSVRAKLVPGRWPDGFGNYVSQVCLRLMSQVDNTASSCNTGQYYDDINNPKGEYMALTYQAYDNNDVPIAGYGGKQWLQLK